ncbi:hypothetical protein BDY21DRAFT_345234 [Lineolata rhizophorae]|uniref:Uncharacterized protein n=1 Tax=Lineolata rhizophorae TaxID=578093 RepID=A0A6A6NZN6_9PEZI|nr:hypothetical protein BDY21DRAFT_345234 [Lineolata rhizophorae]
MPQTEKRIIIRARVTDIPGSPEGRLFQLGDKFCRQMLQRLPRLTVLSDVTTCNMLQASPVLAALFVRIGAAKFGADLLAHHAYYWPTIWSPYFLSSATKQILSRALCYDLTAADPGMFGRLGRVTTMQSSQTEMRRLILAVKEANNMFCLRR